MMILDGNIPGDVHICLYKKEKEKNPKKRGEKKKKKNVYLEGLVNFFLLFSLLFVFFSLNFLSHQLP